jgi:hypothetical protein
MIFFLPAHLPFPGFKMQGERGCLRDLQRYHRGQPQQPVLIEEEAFSQEEEDIPIIEPQNVTRYPIDASLLWAKSFRTNFYPGLLTKFRCNLQT